MNAALLDVDLPLAVSHPVPISVRVAQKIAMAEAQIALGHLQIVDQEVQIALEIVQIVVLPEAQIALGHLLIVDQEQIVPEAVQIAVLPEIQTALGHLLIVDQEQIVPEVVQIAVLLEAQIALGHLLTAIKLAIMRVVHLKEGTQIVALPVASALTAVVMAQRNLPAAVISVEPLDVETSALKYNYRMI